MNKKLYLLPIISFLLTLACKEKNPEPIDKTDPTEEPKEENPILANSPVNNWIYSSMKSYYYWEKEMVDLSQTDLAIEPDSYFKSLLFEQGETDRFSVMYASADALTNSLNGLNSIFGFSYKPFYADVARTRITFSISNSLKNSAAERLEIKRGDFITKVNGETITVDNYGTILKDLETATLTMGVYVGQEVVDSKKTLEITKELTQTKAVQHYEIINIGGKKVGYFAYNQFLTSSDKDVNQAFGEFKSQGIDELVVDFRYNPGGYISSAEIISSLIVKDINTSNLMTRQVWNEEQMASKPASSFETYFSTSNSSAGGTLNTLETLDRVYFLVSNGTASASEMVINNLKPYMEVILVGEHTYGKNVGSITIKDTQEPKRWEWGMQPIVLKTFNAAGESDYGTKEGFAVDIEVQDAILPYKAFGDPDETLLYAALSDILGSDTMARIRSKAKKTPTGTFQAVSPEATYGSEILDRKEMWLTEFPWENK
ncbi:S41 family peptidase [uncultured Arcticibacterium sp.]|uniref:S41 family peptidase n=1 Tax=uncultured Arcticibacterium sp. TaxID=2173042 RepID=UPI0030F87AA1